jgi:hypothetical protein
MIGGGLEVRSSEFGVRGSAFCLLYSVFCILEVRSLVAVAGRKLPAFHGADGADALQGIGQQLPSDRGNDDRWRLGGSEFGVRSSEFGVRGSGFGVRGSGFCLLSSVFCLLSSEFCILNSVFLRFAPS